MARELLGGGSNSNQSVSGMVDCRMTQISAPVSDYIANSLQVQFDDDGCISTQAATEAFARIPMLGQIPVLANAIDATLPHFDFTRVVSYQDTCQLEFDKAPADDCISSTEFCIYIFAIIAIILTIFSFLWKLICGIFGS